MPVVGATAGQTVEADFAAAAGACFSAFIQCAAGYLRKVVPPGPGVQDVKDALSSYAVGDEEEQEMALGVFASIRLYPVEAALVLTLVS